MANFTETLGLVRQFTGENDIVWGEVLNQSMIDLVDEAVAGRLDLDLTDADVVLTDEDGVSTQSRNMILRFTGTPVEARIVYLPLKQRMFTIDNQCGQNVEVKTTTGEGITLEDGERRAIIVDQSSDTVFKTQLHSQNTVPNNPLEWTSVPVQAVTQFTPGTTVTGFDFRYSQQGNIFAGGMFINSYLLPDGITNPPALEFEPVSGLFPVPTRQPMNQLLTGEVIEMVGGFPVANYREHFWASLTADLFSVVRANGMDFVLGDAYLINYLYFPIWSAAPNS